MGPQSRLPFMPVAFQRWWTGSQSTFSRSPWDQFLKNLRYRYVRHCSAPWGSDLGGGKNISCTPATCERRFTKYLPSHCCGPDAHAHGPESTAVNSCLHKAHLTVGLERQLNLNSPDLNGPICHLPNSSISQFSFFYTCDKNGVGIE